MVGLRPSVLRLLSSVLLLTAGCATPLRPSGGPEDRTPPALVSSVPATGATRVTERRLTLTFSERVDETSARRSLVVSPPPERAPDVRADGRDLIITFDSLRADVTYVVTLGTELRDTRNVALTAPLTVAFATGDRIDRGYLTGSVLDPATGRGVAGTAVLAYRLPADSSRLPDPRTTTADYRSQTGADGTFTLDYLRPGPYFVAAITDRNRNGRAEAAEAFAAPPAPVQQATERDSVAATPPTADGRPPTAEPAEPGIRPPSTSPPGQPPARGTRPTTPPAPGGRTPGGRPGAPTLPSAQPTTLTPSATPPFFLTRADTTAPSARTIATRGARTVSVRFDEPVRLDSTGADVWAIEDSVAGRPVPLLGAWLRAEDTREVLVALGGALPTTRHLVRLVRAGAVRDSVGNAVLPFARGFTPSAAADTAQARFAAFLPTVPTAADSALVLRPGERAGLRFTQPIDTAAVRTRLTVRDSEGRPLPYRLVAADPVTFRLDLAARRFTVQVGTDSTRARRYEAPASDALGGLLGQIESPGGTVVIDAIPEGPTVSDRPPFRARTSSDGRFTFPTLPPGAYRLRLFVDRDGDEQWDGGTLAPYTPPEPLAWLQAPVRVRARWETDLGTVRLVNGVATATGLDAGP